MVHSELKQITTSILNPLLEGNFIFVPDWAKKIKIDVGLSINAPNSEVWINEDPEVCVFGFEPNIFNIEHIHLGVKVWSVHLDPKKINKSFFYLNCALSNYISEKESFYCTEGDSGTSSLFKPNYFGVKKVSQIPVLTLESFLDFFPWHRFEYIEHLKVDAQSSDYNVLLGAGHYLSQRVVYVDVETSTNGQYSNVERPNEIKLYLESQGFECLRWGINATFFNNKFSSLKNQIKHIVLSE